MKKINFLTLSTIASLVLIGCGSSSSTTSTTNTGTGYYKDSAVAGVDYVCGTQTGKTDKEGKFTFEKGKECKFSLVGIPLRTTPADKLTDGGTVLEDNPKVAQFLQSIDADGDLSNGIEITDEVLNALTTALENIDDDTTVLSNETVLTTVVAEVGSQVSGVSGTVRTDSEVQAHLAQTQTEITKELLAGKTFYVAYNDHGVNIIETHSINIDVTKDTWNMVQGGTESGTGNLTVDGNKVTYHSDDGDHVISIESMDSKYIYLTGEKKLYLNLEDAKKSFEEALGGHSLSNIVGKTVYQYCESDTDIFQITFQNDGQIKIQGDVEPEYEPYRIDGNTLYATEDGEEKDHTLLEWTDKYIKFSSIGNYDDGTFYFTEADARANPQSDCGGGESSNFDFSAMGSNSNALTYPNGGESWEYDTTEQVKWLISDIKGDSVDIYVLHDDPSDLNNYSTLNDLLNNKSWYKFATNISNNGEYNINPRDLNGNGNAYVILIVGSESGWDVSNSTITLSSN